MAWYFIDILKNKVNSIGQSCISVDYKINWSKYPWRNFKVDVWNFVLIQLYL